MRKYRKPYQFKKKKSILKNRFFWWGIVTVILMGGIFYFFFFFEIFQIKKIEITGLEKTPPIEKIKTITKKNAENIIFFFKTKSIFLVNLNELEKEILKNFPQIEKIDLKRKFPDTLLLQIKERKPVAIFCGKINCFFIDKEGIGFEATERKQDFILLKKKVDQEINLGEKIIEEKKLSKILEVQIKLKNELKIFSEEILLISEERFNIKTLEGWQIYFNFQEDLSWQLTKLKALLEKEISPEKRKDLEYIDLRFGNFAPYKYR
jgi:cell division protein FtsQ